MISKKAIKTLNVGLPLIAAFFCYIIWYSLSENANIATATLMTERALGAVVLLLTVSHIVNYFDTRKN